MSGSESTRAPPGDEVCRGIDMSARVQAKVYQRNIRDIPVPERQPLA